MAYTKFQSNWQDGAGGGTPITEAALDQIETGIYDAHVTADAAIAKTIVDAKGDLIAATSNDAVARLAAGANDTVLVADSAQTTGIKWVQIGNAQVASTAAIAYSKLNLTGGIVNADVSSSAAIAVSKLAAGTNNYVLTTVSGVPTWSSASTLAGTRVYHNADQSIPDATNTALAFNSERFDTDTFHDTATNNSRLTIPSGLAGKYMIGGHAQFAANAVGQRRIYVRLNGSTIIGAGCGTDTAGTGATDLEVTTLYDLAATDYVELVVFQNSGGSRNITAIASYSPEFWLWRLG